MDVVEINQIPVPTGYQGLVALNLAESKIFVSKSNAYDPLILTWVKKQTQAMPALEVIHTEIDEIKKMISNGLGERVVGDRDELQQHIQEQAAVLISDAAKYGANNIHMMMRGTHTEIQFTINSTNRVYKKLSQEDGESISRAIYQGLAQVRDASWQQYQRQNAIITATPERFDPTLGLETIRIVRGPSHPVASGGAFMTMRVQYKSTAPKTREVGSLPALPLPKIPPGKMKLGGMGMTVHQLEKLMMLLRVPNGMIVVTGPTGHGKTTTLVELLTELMRQRPGGRQVTVEDPTEYDMPWAVRQVITNAKTEEETGALYLDMVRTALRMEPRVFFLGELRGADVAVAAVQAVQSGHTVWTTNHAIDPFLFPDRLETLDRERLNKRVFCDPKIVRGIISQRLLPHLCPDCSKPLVDNLEKHDERLVKALKTWGDVSRVRVRGDDLNCRTCHGDAVVSQSAVAEVVLTDDELMADFILHGSSVARSNYRRRRSDADPSMYEAALALALEGKVDPADIEEHVELITRKPIAVADVVTLTAPYAEHRDVA